jgi:pseudaminic acid cytidylyltransferase
MKLAIIPARGGSKRIPRKNVKPFAGKPMIAYAIEAARTSGLFDKVIVSTDDAEILDVARAAGAEAPFMRPTDLADDHTPTVPVIRHAIEMCRDQGWPVDWVCCIYPGVPFLQVEDLVSAFDLLQANGGEGYVFPVTGFPSPIQRALKMDDSACVAPFNPQYASTRTQDLEPAFFDAGQFYWGAADTWLQGLNIHAHGRGIVLPEWRVVDIDTPADWDRAEALHQVLSAREAKA